MKSPMIQNSDYITNKDSYSDLQIIKSAAGYYIGTLYTEKTYGFTVPGSRDSTSYFETLEEAGKYLALIEKLGPDIAATMLRQHP